jgi:hypothetical protein
VTFAADVTIAGDLVIEDAASVTFSGKLTVGGTLRILRAGAVAFNGPLTLDGNASVGRADDLDAVATLTVAGPVTFSGDTLFATRGALAFAQSVLAAAPSASLTLATGAALSFGPAARLELGPARLAVTQAASATFAASVLVGALTLRSSGSITFSAADNTADSLDLTSTAANGLVTLRSFAIGSGDATVTANRIDLTGPLADAGPASALTFKPFTTGRALSIGTAALGAPAAVLDFSANDLAAIQAGFSTVTFGDAAAGTGAVYLGRIGQAQSTARLLNATVIVGGSITVTRAVDSAAQLSLVARTGSVTVNGALNQAPSERASELSLEASGAITLNRAVYASVRITLLSGTSTVDNLGRASAPEVRTSPATLVVVPALPPVVFTPILTPVAPAPVLVPAALSGPVISVAQPGFALVPETTPPAALVTLNPIASAGAASVAAPARFTYFTPVALAPSAPSSTPFAFSAPTLSVYASIPLAFNASPGSSLLDANRPAFDWDFAAPGGVYGPGSPGSFDFGGAAPDALLATLDDSRLLNELSLAV